MLIKFEEELNRLIAERAHELSSATREEYGGEVTYWLKAEQEMQDELDCRSTELFKEDNKSPARFPVAGLSALRHDC